MKDLLNVKLQWFESFRIFIISLQESLHNFIWSYSDNLQVALAMCGGSCKLSSLSALSANLPDNGGGILWKLDLPVQKDIDRELFRLCFKSKKYQPTSGDF